MRYSHPPLLNPLIRVEGSINSWGIGKFLVLMGTLLVTIILSATVIATYQVASSYLDQAYSRNAQVRALAQAHEINQMLVAARYELEYLTRQDPTPESMRHHLGAKSTEERNRYREIAFYGQRAEEHFVVVNTGDQRGSSTPWTRPWGRNSASSQLVTSWLVNPQATFRSANPWRSSILDPCGGSHECPQHACDPPDNASVR